MVKIKTFIDGFINRRGVEPLPVEFNWRRIYVLPSKPGLFFAVIWVVMLMAALNFNNNMGLMLVFLLFGMTQVMLLQTFFNMRNITLRRIKVEPVFLGDVAEAQLELCHSQDKWQVVSSSLGKEKVAHIEHGVGLLPFHFETIKRGYEPVPRIKLFTRYPMGLFTVWVYCTPDTSALVYPKPERPVPAYPSHGGVDGEKDLPIKGDELASVREYQVGDPLRDIAWKKTAQSDKTWVKQYESTQGKHMMFDFEQMHMAHTEAKLSRLAAWVIQAEHENIDYQLVLPGFSSEMTHGAAQMALCLKQLALFGGGESSPN
ncbi:DUF58 domain-containing protein [Marinicella rhabdoformis]|uniref:DUF58 domain-containing protein n=1 Tax=Marinicella rhabdoformis TaxID=2580566 RepID=UPI0012AEB968|nr:DUF58 domain-containing protein [Marinicella rhabdoformis]